MDPETKKRLSKLPLDEKARLLISNIRHCQVIGLTVTSASPNQLTLELPYSDQLIGNPETGVIHGGALTTLMDTACGFAVAISMENLAPCPTLDLRIDYMTAATPGRSVYGKAEVYRMTENVVFTKGVAYHAEDENPIAHCVATFMRLSKESLGKN